MLSHLSWVLMLQEEVLAMQYDFSLDNVKASTVGIVLQKPITVSPLTPRYITKVVPKYGTYHIFDGYEERQLSISAFVLSSTLSTDLDTAYDFLLQTSQRSIVLYEGNTAYYTCAGVLLNGGEIDRRGGVLNPFTATFEVHDV